MSVNVNNDSKQGFVRKVFRLNIDMAVNSADLIILRDIYKCSD